MTACRVRLLRQVLQSDSANALLLLLFITFKDARGWIGNRKDFKRLSVLCCTLLCMPMILQRPGRRMELLQYPGCVGEGMVESVPLTKEFTSHLALVVAALRGKTLTSNHSFYRVS